MEKMDAKYEGVIRKVKDGSILPDTQWIVFDVKDDAFWKTLPTYRLNCGILGADSQQMAAVDRMIRRVMKWREENPDKCKVPDAKGEKLLDVEGGTRGSSEEEKA